MNPTENTKSTFERAVQTVIEMEGQWPEPSIYAYLQDDGQMVFDCAPKTAMPRGVTLWLVATPDSFGDLTGDHQEDAFAIAAEMYEQAVQDVQDAHRLQEEYGV